MSRAKYLVTGGAGFIGSHLIEALLGRGEAVVVLDNFASGKRANLDAAFAARRAGAPEPLFIEGDIRDRAVVRRSLAGVTHVLHQAALGSVPRSVEDPHTTHEVNATGTLNLLIEARDAGVRRFVFASSSSVYGDTPTLPKIETMPTSPRSPYAISKLTAEQYCQVFAALYGFETVALRYFNIFGPRQDPDSQYAAVIPKFMTGTFAGTPVTVHGDGLQSRDFTYVENAVQANLKACEAPGAAGVACNIACGSSATLLEILARIGTIAGRPPQPVHGPPRAGDVKHSLASIDLARARLGYEPTVGLEEGLRRAAASYRA